MLRVVAYRALATLPLVFAIGVASFVALRLVPGDAVATLLGENYDADVAATLREQLGLDRPAPEQFMLWIKGVVVGDLGVSLISGRSVNQQIGASLPATFELVGLALLLAVAIGIPVGVAAASRHNGLIDVGSRVTMLTVMSIPNFFVGILLIYIFAVYIPLFPSGGWVAFSNQPWSNFLHVVLPVVTLASSMSATTMRMTRVSMLDVLSQDFIRTAKAKGASRSSVLYEHALRNALIPISTVVGIQASRLLAGTVIVESVFSIPGLGSLLVDSLTRRDYTMAQGTIMVLASMVITINLIIDLAYAAIDPRIRHG